LEQALQAYYLPVVVEQKREKGPMLL